MDRSSTLFSSMRLFVALILLLLFFPSFGDCYSKKITTSVRAGASEKATAAAPVIPTFSSGNKKRNESNKHRRNPSHSTATNKHQSNPIRHHSTFDTALGISSHVGAAVTAVVELSEDFESIGHGHGMLLLVCSRLAREINLLRMAVVDEMEELSHLSKNHQLWWRIPLEPLFFVGRLLSSQLVASILACAALAAAVLEVVQDSQPGGHHGAVLLAVNELWELIELSHIVPPQWRFLLHQHVLRLGLVSGAFIVAVAEAWQERQAGITKVGGHHGVAMFAIAKILRVVALMRSEIHDLSEQHHDGHAHNPRNHDTTCSGTSNQKH